MAEQAAIAKVADAVLKDLEKKLSAKSLGDFPSKQKALTEIGKTRKVLAAVETDLLNEIKREKQR